MRHDSYGRLWVRRGVVSRSAAPGRVLRVLAADSPSCVRV
ncbi:MAG: hypothetical protein KDI67_04145 [Gammaproteobacteria bacterium]|nr:hypothetical protein [Gammaproteobacteria bacterium]